MRGVGRAGRRGWVGVAAAALAVVGAACGGGPDTPPPPDPTTVTVGSFDFAESELLAEIYAQALEGAGFEVERAFGIGPRELTLPALEQGLVDVVPEYAGSALVFLGGAPTSDAITTIGRLREATAARGMETLDPAEAENTNVFALSTATASRLGLHRLTQLEPVAGELTFGGPPECRDRPLCLQGLEDVYGLRFRDFVPLDAGGPLTLQALDEGHVDVALLFSTAGRLGSGELVALEDDRGLQPAENVTPLVAAGAADRFGPELEATLDAVSAALTTDGLRVMNASLQLGVTTEQVARGWLVANGLGRSGA
jgi:osmoprotectant transport system substrate-binding protein